MGINLVRDKAFGDPHAEAWVVISRHMWGLRARAATTFRSMNPFMSHLDWYQVKCIAEQGSVTNAPGRGIHQGRLARQPDKVV